jgi:aarF domain-containing kinase
MSKPEARAGAAAAQKIAIRQAAVPQGRISRFLHLGRAVGELALSSAKLGASRWVRGDKPDLSQLLLTPANARRLAQRLSAMRGAVMKVGQLMSMDTASQGVLPAEFAELLGGLRNAAHTLPAAQLTAVLKREYGARWQTRFRSLDLEPLAAASIGQVHRAQTHDGQFLALKIQYPGVRDSIDSDMANLALLARLPGLVPAGLDMAPLLARVREQLLRETDYRAEARAATLYRTRLGADPALWVPAVVPEHCSPHIIASEFAAGVPVDQWAADQAPQAERDRVAAALVRLAVREFFEMGVVQTDPNFGNYLFDAHTGKVALLDFGAAEKVLPARARQLTELCRAMRDGDTSRIGAAAARAGFISPDDPSSQSQAVVQLMLAAGEPLRHAGPYDFERSDLFGRLFAQGQAQFFGDGFARTPPPDLLFLQRKFVGTFLLCVRLRARVDLALAFSPHL